MTAGSLLARTFAIFFQNFLPFTLITALIHVPLLLYTAFGAIDETLGTVIDNASLVLGPVATGALTYSVVERLRGNAPSLGQSLSIGFGRLLPVLGVAILSGLAIFGGTLLLVIPGVILACMLYVAVPVAVIEKPGLIASLKRSNELTDGAKMIIFAAVLVIGLLQFGLAFAMGGFIFVGDLFHPRGLLLAIVALSIVSSTLTAVAAAVAYSELRRDKEGVDIDGLASVFD